MEPLSSVAAIASGAFILLVMVVVFLMFLSPAEAKTLLLERMLRRQGDDVARAALASGSREFVDAVQRCLACRQAAQCQAWLSSGARQGYEHFCPNAGYLERLKVGRE